MNMGGGFGIDYRGGEAPPVSAFAAAILPAVKQTGCKLVLEPGRFIAGNAGALITRVIYTKEPGGRTFVVQDGGMNDLIRPTLYEAFHKIWPVAPAADVPTWPADLESDLPNTRPTDVVGPVCETGDYLARDRRLPALNPGDLLAVFSAGAYGMAMSSNYNSRPAPRRYWLTATRTGSSAGARRSTTWSAASVRSIERSPWSAFNDSV